MTLRLDAALVRRGLVRSRNRAQREIRAGRVAVDGQTATKPSATVSDTADITVDSADPWVARSAHKLIGALDAFALTPSGLNCLDAGASTGGFTQVLLSRGAEHVWAVDVGTAQLDPGLRSSPAVTSLEEHNLRNLTGEWLGGRKMQMTVADVSFISLTLIAQPLLENTEGDLVLMVKPQFEAGRSALDKHGVVTDPQARAEAVCSVAEHVEKLGGQLCGIVQSSLPGPTGNIEYFLWAHTGQTQRPLPSASAGQKLSRERLAAHVRAGAHHPLTVPAHTERKDRRADSLGGEEAR
ncbi:TlyA family RNA methyltransferase [Brevibacterium sp. Marseille-P9724]|uniref:TlyA family RNA methyltransferase n=1 Tax=Brevibacterium sp. Marseille-P9724 TaxID=2614125 RepID=UPI00125EE726|nr:TlyA family RNA methyltransferase [Brevibacterium sp. Marseille-P9724]